MTWHDVIVALLLPAAWIWANVWVWALAALMP